MRVLPALSLPNGSDKGESKDLFLLFTAVSLELVLFPLTPSDSHTCAYLRPHSLSFDIHPQNTRGWGAFLHFPYCELTAENLELPLPAPVTPLFPLHTRSVPVTPLFPLHTQKQGGRGGLPSEASAQEGTQYLTCYLSMSARRHFLGRVAWPRLIRATLTVFHRRRSTFKKNLGELCQTGQPAGERNLRMGSQTVRKETFSLHAWLSSLCLTSRRSPLGMTS